MPGYVWFARGGRTVRRSLVFPKTRDIVRNFLKTFPLKKRKRKETQGGYLNRKASRCQVGEAEKKVLAELR